MEQKYARTYPIFYDETKKVTKSLKQETKISKLGRLPGMLIVDKKGIVQYAYYGDSMKDIPNNADILEVLTKINKNN